MLVPCSLSLSYPFHRPEGFTCAGCSSFHYCDVECQKDDWKSVHGRNECKFYQKLRKCHQKQAFLTSESVHNDLKLRLFLLIKSKKWIEWKKFPLFNGTERSFDDLMQDDGQRSKYEDKLQDTLTLVRQIDPELFSARGDVPLMREVFHKIRINCHGIEFEDEYQPVAFGISIPVSALNHSCRPNAAISFKDYVVEVRIMKNIAAGEEVTISYITNLPLSKHERQKEVSKQRGFICKCDRCQAGDTPDEVEDMRKIYAADHFIKFLSSPAKRSVVMFDKLLEVLPIREELQGPFHRSLTMDMLSTVKNRLFSDTPLSVRDKENMQMLMAKIMESFPITHGSDHWLYPDVLKL
jgi:hypothetical protein